MPARSRTPALSRVSSSHYTQESDDAVSAGMCVIRYSLRHGIAKRAFDLDGGLVLGTAYGSKVASTQAPIIAAGQQRREVRQKSPLLAMRSQASRQSTCVPYTCFNYYSVVTNLSQCVLTICPQNVFTSAVCKASWFRPGELVWAAVNIHIHPRTLCLLQAIDTSSFERENSRNSAFCSCAAPPFPKCTADTVLAQKVASAVQIYDHYHLASIRTPGNDNYVNPKLRSSNTQPRTTPQQPHVHSNRPQQRQPVPLIQHGPQESRAAARHPFLYRH